MSSTGPTPSVGRRDDRGSGLLSTVIGVACVAALLGLAVNLTLGLWVRSTVDAVAYDAARDLATTYDDGERAAAASDIDLVMAVPSWSELLAHTEFPVDVVLLDLDLRDNIPISLKLSMLKSAGVQTMLMSTYSEPAVVREARTVPFQGLQTSPVAVV